MRGVKSGINDLSDVWTRNNAHSDAIVPRDIVAPRYFVGGRQGSICLGELGEAGFLNAELIHARAEGVRMEIQPSGGTLFPFNDPVDLLQDMQDMRPLDFFHGSLAM